MKTKSFATLGVLALLAAGTAFGQQMLSADIPFQFSYANQAMPAGHYEVTHLNSGALLVRSFTTGASAFAAVNNAGDVKAGEAQSCLVFNKYGDKYFLEEVRPPAGDNWASQVIMSKTEREVARGNGDVARVTIPARTGAVTVALAR